jgi:cob(I)alamin adenosyltransferase
MIHYYYGDGKGKTSSANGALIRAAGSGMKCALVQFFKNGTSSEIEILKKTGVDVYFCDFKNMRFFSKMSGEERVAVISSHNENLKKVLAADHDLIVLDEFGDAVLNNAADETLINEILSLSECEIIITGHATCDRILRVADYITEFKCIAHPYQKGIKARKGIEF